MEHINNKMYYDVLGVLVETTELKEIACQQRRDVIIMDQSYNQIRVVLWEEQAVHDAMCLDYAQNCKSIVAFCNVTTSEMDGTIRFESEEVTTVMLNPNIEKAHELLNWNRALIARNIDITLAPSMQFRNAVPIPLLQLLDSTFDIPGVVFCKFYTTIKQVHPKNYMCYGLCKTSNIVVDSRGGTNYCKRCKEYRDAVNYTYFVELDVTADFEDLGQEISITVQLFGGARFLLGCKADKYMQSIVEQGEISQYYQRMISAEGKSYTFMLKNYHKIPQPKRMTEFEVEELHTIEQPEASTSDRGKRPLENEVQDAECSEQSGKRFKNHET